MLAVEALLAEKKKAFLRATNDHIEAKMALNRLMGNDLFDPLCLQDATADAYQTLPIESLLRYALLHRNDRSALQAQIDALEARYKASKSMHAPKFYLFGGYSFLESAPPQSPRMNTPDKNWVSGGIGMRLPLYEGGKDQSQVDKTRAQLAQAKAQLQELESLIMMDVEKAYMSMQEAFSNISIEETAILLAEENLRSITDRYSQGLVSINDVLISFEQVSQSRMNKNRAIYRYHAAYARLCTAVGGKP